MCGLGHMSRFEPTYFHVSADSRGEYYCNCPTTHTKRDLECLEDWRAFHSSEGKRTRCLSNKYIDSCTNTHRHAHTCLFCVVAGCRCCCYLFHLLLLLSLELGKLHLVDRSLTLQTILPHVHGGGGVPKPYVRKNTGQITSKHEVKRTRVMAKPTRCCMDKITVLNTEGELLRLLSRSHLMPTAVVDDTVRWHRLLHADGAPMVTNSRVSFF